MVTLYIVNILFMVWGVHYGFRSSGRPLVRGGTGLTWERDLPIHMVTCIEDAPVALPGRRGPMGPGPVPGPELGPGSNGTDLRISRNSRRVTFLGVDDHPLTEARRLAEEVPEGRWREIFTKNRWLALLENPTVPLATKVAVSGLVLEDASPSPYTVNLLAGGLMEDW